jgi:GNAT superfamily N-acetyltransferase
VFDAVLCRLDEERRSVAHDGEILHVPPYVTRLRGNGGSYHLVAWSRLTRDNADAIIEQEISYHRGLGVGFEWKLYAHDGPPDLMGRLEAKGFCVGPREAVLACDLSEPTEWIEHVDHGGAVRVERIERVEQIADYRKVEEDAFARNPHDSTDQLLRALRTGLAEVRGYIAYSDDEPVSVGRLYTHPGSWFGGLYGGGTRPSFHGRGFYRALVAARARDARAAGAKYLLVDALPTSRPILERLGFQWLTDTWPCEWTPGDIQTELSEEQ